MAQAMEITVNDLPAETTGRLKRFSVFAYGLLAQAIGCTGLFWLIFALGGLAPVGSASFQTDSLLSALLVNVGLILAFGIQHSGMARISFKQWITRYIPVAAERATYMLMSGIVTMSAIYFWQPLPGVVWSVESIVGQVILYALYTFGWGYLLMSTFVTNHFELMGLRQVYLYFRNKPYTALPFTRKYMYSYSRHPMMLGVLIGLWAVPQMSMTHFIMALLLTSYIAIGVSLEEKDLEKNFGDTYRGYKKDIATLIPKVIQQKKPVQ